MDKCLLCNTSLIYEMSLSFLLSFRRLKKKYICPECMEKFSQIDLNKSCRCCGRQMQQNGICLDCQKWKVTGDVFINKAIYQYNDAMKDFMHRYKFVGDYQLRMIFQDQIKKMIKNENSDVVVPIPISDETWQQRGFNQVTGLIGDTDYVNALRVMSTAKVRQSSLNRKQRITRKQDFIINQECVEKIINQNVLLVDDIYTTGTTIRHAASVIKKSGAKSVCGLTLCR